MSETTALREAIRALLLSHPAIRLLDHNRSHLSSTDKMHRYVYGEDRGIGHEADLKTQQNLWVHANAVRLDRLADIEHDHRYRDTSKGRHSNLHVIPGFSGEPLIKFVPKTAWEAARIILEAVGDGRSDV